MSERHKLTASSESPINVIGFEDTPRGLKALVDTRRHFARLGSHVNVVPVFVSNVDYPGIDDYLADAADASRPQYVRLTSLAALNDDVVKPLLATSHV